MNKIKPIEKGQCNCCAGDDIYVRKCKIKQCDYSMCNMCYKKYYETNTICPACRQEVETNLCKIITNYINSNQERDIESGEENHPVFHISCNCLNRIYIIRNSFNCYCIYDLTNYETCNYRRYINKFKECLINFLAILALLIALCLCITLILTIGRLMYLFTSLVFYPDLTQTFLINNVIFLLLSCLLGLLFTVLWFYCAFCCCAILLGCAHTFLEDDF
jgi:hypothetical protein